MATSPIYSWPEPDNTDLVKNGALAIRTMGNAIDTTMATMVPKSIVDAKGDLVGATANDTPARLAVGTNGQVLIADSTAATGLAWADAASGDITGVTAGTGISGGGTSGTVTVTNSMATAITTAGDLIKGTGSGTFDRLGIGSTGQVLTVAAGAPSWATPASAGSGPAFRAFRNTTAQSISQSTYTKVQLNAETYDTANCFDSTTNYRFTPTTAGYYQINAGIILANSTVELIAGKIYKNGSGVTILFYTRNTQTDEGYYGSDLIYLNGTTDYLELYARADGGGTREVGYGASDTFMSGVWIRS